MPLSSTKNGRFVYKQKKNDLIIQNLKNIFFSVTIYFCFELMKTTIFCECVLDAHRRDGYVRLSRMSSLPQNRVASNKQVKLNVHSLLRGGNKAVKRAVNRYHRRRRTHV